MLNILNIDHELMGEVKTCLNNAISTALANLGRFDTATIALKIEIEQSDEMKDSKELLPIDFSCNVTIKSDAMKHKGTVSRMIVTQSELGFLASSADGQISIFEICEGLGDD